MSGAVNHTNSRAVQVIIGVDTHKTSTWRWLLTGEVSDLTRSTCPLPPAGTRSSERWSCDLGQVHTFGIEGTGSYGAGLARFLTDRSYRVVEVNRPDRSVAIVRGRVTPPTPRWQRAQCLQVSPTLLPSLAKAK